MAGHVHVYLNAETTTQYEYDVPDDEELSSVVITGEAGTVEHKVTPSENAGLPISIRIVSKDMSYDVPPVVEDPPVTRSTKTEEKAESKR